MIRIGIVLGPDGGALKQMLPPFKAGVGGRLGSGKQWMSWIHVEDLIELFVLALADKNVRGPVNGVAPLPVRNEQFTADLASVLHRPAIFPIPVVGLKWMFGERARVLMDTQRFERAAAHKAAFRFSFPVLKPALQTLLG